MRNWLRANLVCSTAGILAFGLLNSDISVLGAPKTAFEIASETIIVKPIAGAGEDAVKRALEHFDATQARSLPQLNVRFLNVPAAARDAVLGALARHPLFEFAEADEALPISLLPNDPYVTSNMEWHLAKIAAPLAWDLTTGNANIVIAVLDTGIESTHPDLAANLVAGWNLYDNNADTSDVHGHGTAVAGQAGAIGNNGIGVAAPAWGCRLMPVRIADIYGWTTGSLLASGLVYAADHGARVANISFQASSGTTIREAQQYFFSKGGVVTVSAGNGAAFDNSAENPYVLTVSATDSNDALATFSNTGNNIDLAAPGVSIATTAVGGKYGFGSGTSASAPLVAGVAALILSVNPALSPGDVQNILKQTADDLGTPGWDTTFGAGRLNAGRAVLVASSARPSDATPPVATINSPGSGTAVAGSVAVNVLAGDNVGVTRLEWYVDGTLMGFSSSAPATFSWDTSKFANGSHSLQAQAYDAAGNRGISPINMVSVQNVTLPPPGPVADVIAPLVQIASPATGASVSKTLSVIVKASDNVRVTRVDLLLDNRALASSSSATPTFSINTAKLSRGQHTLQALAYDAAGNCGKSLIVTIKK